MSIASFRICRWVKIVACVVVCAMLQQDILWAYPASAWRDNLAPQPVSETQGMTVEGEDHAFTVRSKMELQAVVLALYEAFSNGDALDDEIARLVDISPEMAAVLRQIDLAGVRWETRAGKKVLCLPYGEYEIRAFKRRDFPEQEGTVAGPAVRAREQLVEVDLLFEEGIQVVRREPIIDEQFGAVGPLTDPAERRRVAQLSALIYGSELPVGPADNALALLYRAGGEIQGYVLADIREGTVHITDVAVSEEYQSRGIGTRLLREFIDQMRVRGNLSFEMFVPFSSPMARVARNLGFVLQPHSQMFFTLDLRTPPETAVTARLTPPITGPGRNRHMDEYIVRYLSTLSGSDHVVVDFGIGFPPVTTVELKEAVAGKARVIGMDVTVPSVVVSFSSAGTSYLAFFDTPTGDAPATLIVEAQAGMSRALVHDTERETLLGIQALGARDRLMADGDGGDYTDGTGDSIVFFPVEKLFAPVPGLSVARVDPRDGFSLPVDGQIDVIRSANVFYYYNQNEMNAALRQFAEKLAEGGICLIGEDRAFVVYVKDQGVLRPRELCFHLGMNDEELAGHIGSWIFQQDRLSSYPDIVVPPGARTSFPQYGVFFDLLRRAFAGTVSEYTDNSALQEAATRANSSCEEVVLSGMTEALARFYATFDPAEGYVRFPIPSAATAGESNEITGIGGPVSLPANDRAKTVAAQPGTANVPSPDVPVSVEISSAAQRIVSDPRWQRLYTYYLTLVPLPTSPVGMGDLPGLMERAIPEIEQAFPTEADDVDYRSAYMNLVASIQGIMTLLLSQIPLEDRQRQRNSASEERFQALTSRVREIAAASGGHLSYNDQRRRPYQQPQKRNASSPEEITGAETGTDDRAARSVPGQETDVSRTAGESAEGSGGPTDPSGPGRRSVRQDREEHTQTVQDAGRERIKVFGLYLAAYLILSLTVGFAHSAEALVLFLPIALSVALLRGRVDRRSAIVTKVCSVLVMLGTVIAHPQDAGWVTHVMTLLTAELMVIGSLAVVFKRMRHGRSLSNPQRTLIVLCLMIAALVPQQVRVNKELDRAEQRAALLTQQGTIRAETPRKGVIRRRLSAIERMGNYHVRMKAYDQLGASMATGIKYVDKRNPNGSFLYGPRARVAMMYMLVADPEMLEFMDANNVPVYRSGWSSPPWVGGFTDRTNHGFRYYFNPGGARVAYNIDPEDYNPATIRQAISDGKVDVPLEAVDQLTEDDTTNDSVRSIYKILEHETQHYRDLFPYFDNWFSERLLDHHSVFGLKTMERRAFERSNEGARRAGFPVTFLDDFKFVEGAYTVENVMTFMKVLLQDVVLFFFFWFLVQPGLIARAVLRSVARALRLEYALYEDMRDDVAFARGEQWREYYRSRQDYVETSLSRVFVRGVEQLKDRPDALILWLEITRRYENYMDDVLRHPSRGGAREDWQEIVRGLKYLGAVLHRKHPVRPQAFLGRQFGRGVRVNGGVSINEDGDIIYPITTSSRFRQVIAALKDGLATIDDGHLIIETEVDPADGSVGASTCRIEYTDGEIVRMPYRLLEQVIQTGRQGFPASVARAAAMSDGTSSERAAERSLGVDETPLGATVVLTADGAADIVMDEWFLNMFGVAEHDRDAVRKGTIEEDELLQNYPELGVLKAGLSDWALSQRELFSTVPGGAVTFELRIRYDMDAVADQQGNTVVLNWAMLRAPPALQAERIAFLTVVFSHDIGAHLIQRLDELSAQRDTLSYLTAPGNRLALEATVRMIGSYPDTILFQSGFAGNILNAAEQLGDPRLDTLCARARTAQAEAVPGAYSNAQSQGESTEGPGNDFSEESDDDISVVEPDSVGEVIPVAPSIDYIADGRRRGVVPYSRALYAFLSGDEGVPRPPRMMRSVPLSRIRGANAVMSFIPATGRTPLQISLADLRDDGELGPENRRIEFEVSVRHADRESGIVILEATPQRLLENGTDVTATVPERVWQRYRTKRVVELTSFDMSTGEILFNRGLGDFDYWMLALRYGLQINRWQGLRRQMTTHGCPLGSVDHIDVRSSVFLGPRIPEGTALEVRLLGVEREEDENGFLSLGTLLVNISVRSRVWAYTMPEIVYVDRNGDFCIVHEPGKQEILRAVPLRVQKKVDFEARQMPALTLSKDDLLAVAAGKEGSVIVYVDPEGVFDIAYDTLTGTFRVRQHKFGIMQGYDLQESADTVTVHGSRIVRIEHELKRTRHEEYLEFMEALRNEGVPYFTDEVAAGESETGPLNIDISRIPGFDQLSIEEQLDVLSAIEGFAQKARAGLVPVPGPFIQKAGVQRAPGKTIRKILMMTAPKGLGNRAYLCDKAIPGANFVRVVPLSVTPSRAEVTFELSDALDDPQEVARMRERVGRDMEDRFPDQADAMQVTMRFDPLKGGWHVVSNSKQVLSGVSSRSIASQARTLIWNVDLREEIEQCVQDMIDLSAEQTAQALNARYGPAGSGACGPGTGYSLFETVNVQGIRRRMGLVKIPYERRTLMELDAVRRVVVAEIIADLNASQEVTPRAMAERLNQRFAARLRAVNEQGRPLRAFTGPDIVSYRQTILRGQLRDLRREATSFIDAARTGTVNFDRSRFWRVIDRYRERRSLSENETRVLRLLTGTLRAQAADLLPPEDDERAIAMIDRAIRARQGGVYQDLLRRDHNAGELIMAADRCQEIIDAHQPASGASQGESTEGISSFGADTPLSSEASLRRRHINTKVYHLGVRVQELMAQLSADEQGMLGAAAAILYMAVYIEEHVGLAYLDDFLTQFQINVSREQIEEVIAHRSFEERARFIFADLLGMSAEEQERLMPLLTDLWPLVGTGRDLAREARQRVLSQYLYYRSPAAQQLNRQRQALVDQYRRTVPDRPVEPVELTTLGINPSYACGRGCRHCQVVNLPARLGTEPSREERQARYTQAFAFAVEHQIQNLVISGGEPIGMVPGEVQDIIALSGTWLNALGADAHLYVTTNASFASDSASAEERLRPIIEQFRAVAGEGQRLVVQISVDEFHQETMLDPTGTVRERIPLTNVAILMQCLRERFPDVGITIINRFTYFSELIWFDLQTELMARGYEIFECRSAHGNDLATVTKVKVVGTSGALEDRELLSELPFTLRTAGAVDGSLRTDEPLYLYAASYINRVGWGTDLYPFEYAVNQQDQMADFMAQREFASYPVTDAGVEPDGSVIFDGSVFASLWAAGTIDEGLSAVCDRMTEDPLWILYRTDPQLLLHWVREILPVYQDIIIASPNLNSALYEIMKSPAMRTYLTRRALLTLADDGTISGEVLTELGLPDSVSGVAEEFLAQYGAELRAIEQLRRAGVYSAERKTSAADPDSHGESSETAAASGRTERYYVMNKPVDMLSNTEDRQGRGRRTVYEHLRDAGIDTNGLMPVGRLDYDARGLKLFTTNGALVTDLILPAGHVEKVYRVVVRGDVTPEQLARLQAGVSIPGHGGSSFVAWADAVSLLPETAAGTSVLEVTITQGKFHQVKEMMAAIGHPEVIDLERIRLGPLSVEGIADGEVRELTDTEIEQLHQAHAVAIDRFEELMRTGGSGVSRAVAYYYGLFHDDDADEPYPEAMKEYARARIRAIAERFPGPAIESLAWALADPSASYRENYVIPLIRDILSGPQGADVRDELLRRSARFARSRKANLVRQRLQAVLGTAVPPAPTEKRALIAQVEGGRSFEERLSAAQELVRRNDIHELRGILSNGRNVFGANYAAASALAAHDPGARALFLAVIHQNRFTGPKRAAARALSVMDSGVRDLSGVLFHERDEMIKQIVAEEMRDGPAACRKALRGIAAGSTYAAQIARDVLGEDSLSGDRSAAGAQEAERTVSTEDEERARAAIDDARRTRPASGTFIDAALEHGFTPSEVQRVLKAAGRFLHLSTQSMRLPFTDAIVFEQLTEGVGLDLTAAELLEALNLGGTPAQRDARERQILRLYDLSDDPFEQCALIHFITDIMDQKIERQRDDDQGGSQESVGAPVTTIIFDLDNTLYRSDEYQQAISSARIQFVAQTLGVSAEDAGVLIEKKHQALQMRLGRAVGYIEVLMSLLSLPYDETTEQWGRFKYSFIDTPSLIHPDERLQRTLRRLAQRYRLVVLTNGERDEAQRILRLLGVEWLIQDLFCQADIGSPKQDLAVNSFTALAQMIGADPRTCVSIGDTYAADIMPAERAGMRAIQVNSIRDIYRLPARVREFALTDPSVPAFLRPVIAAIQEGLDQEGIPAGVTVYLYGSALIGRFDGEDIDMAINADDRRRVRALVGDDGVTRFIAGMRDAVEGLGLELHNDTVLPFTAENFIGKYGHYYTITQGGVQRVRCDYGVWLAGERDRLHVAINYDKFTAQNCRVRIAEMITRFADDQVMNVNDLVRYLGCAQKVFNVFVMVDDALGAGTLTTATDEDLAALDEMKISFAGILRQRLVAYRAVLTEGTTGEFANVLTVAFGDATDTQEASERIDESAEEVPASYLLGALGLDDPEATVLAEHDLGDTHIRRIGLAPRTGMDPAELTGLAILQHELAHPERVDLRVLDVLSAPDGRIIAVFPVLPEEVDSGSGAGDPSLPLISSDRLQDTAISYLDVSPYYLPALPLANGQADRAWQIVKPRYTADQERIAAYREHRFGALGPDVVPPLGKYSNFSYMTSAKPTYRIVSVDPRNGDLSMRTVPFTSEHLNDQFLPRGFTHLIIPVFPLVYPSITAATDQAYYRALFTQLDIQEDDDVLVVGPGSGIDTWLVSLKTKKPVTVIGLNPLEVANTQATAAAAGFQVEAIVADNIIDEQGRPRLAKRYDKIIWNMPLYTSGPLLPVEAPASLENAWDGDAFGVTLKRFAQGLPILLKPGAEALVWNEASDSAPDVVALLRSAGRYDDQSLGEAEERGERTEYMEVDEIRDMVYLVTNPEGESQEAGTATAAEILTTQVRALHRLHQELRDARSAQSHGKQIIVPEELIPDGYRDRLTQETLSGDIRLVSSDEMDALIRDATNSAIGPSLILVLNEEIIGRYPALDGANCQAERVLLNRYDPSQGVLYLEGAIALARAVAFGDNDALRRIYRQMTGADLSPELLNAFQTDRRFVLNLPGAVVIDGEQYRDLMETTLAFLQSA